MKTLLLASLLCLVAQSSAVAQKPRSLLVGELVRYRGTSCGQVDGTWLSGTITKSGQFLSSNSSLAALRARLKKTARAKRAPILRQIRSLERRIRSQSTTCTSLGTGVIAPRSTQSAGAGFTPIAWNFDLGFLNLSPSAIGQEYSYFCAANGDVDSVWGTDTYTADSSVCNAAVHAGLIRRDRGGNVRLRVKAGLERYLGGIRNGVTSLTYTSYALSFSFLNPTTGNEVGSSAPPILPWGARVDTLRNALGSSFTFLCPANGSPGSVWGTTTYTNDSTVCPAAVHAGKISLKLGGEISVRIDPGLSSYVGSKRNGITSNSYGSWNGSIGFN